MRIVSNVLEKVDYKDIVNGTVIIPKGVTSIGGYAFENCKSLETIIIPEGVTSIGEYAFHGCESLKTIVLPNSLTSIGRVTFFCCVSLETIIIPEGVTSIGEGAFGSCESLKTIVLPNSLTSIGRDTFFHCVSLETIIIPEGVTSIGEYAFHACKSLKIITLPNGLTNISDHAFYGCDSLNTLITPYGKIQKNGYKDIVPKYLYLYTNSILKEKYTDFDDFLSQLSQLFIRDIFNNNNSNMLLYNKTIIPKFKNLFYKLRKDFDISPSLFSALSLEETEKFDYKIWNKIKNLFDLKDIEMSEAVSEMIAIFGLFENDNGAKGRLQDYIDFVHNKNVILTDNIPYHADLIDYYICYALESGVDEFDIDLTQMQEMKNSISAYITAVDYTYYQLKSGVIIPKEFNIDLTQNLTMKERKNIKKLTGNYGKKINDFVKENYEIVNRTGYKIINNSECFNENGNFVNQSTLHRMFDGCNKKFDLDFYNFLMKYMDTILKNEIYQRKIKDIQKHFQSIKTYYKLHAGIDDITLKQAINYVENIGFDNVHEGNMEFAKEVKKSGVASQEAFEYYQKIFELNDQRKLSSLIKRSNIYEINGYKIKTELLRKDDSFSMLVGETNYTNCCQVFGGVGHNCLAHAVNSEDGGIFVTKLIKDDEEILLTESWDWQNNNVYCHDNIEGTPYFEKNKDLHDVVAKAIELDALEIIRKSREEVEKYIIERSKKIEKSLLSKEEKDKELEELAELEKREVIRLVTVGSGNSDLELSNYYSNTINVDDNNTFNHQTFTLAHFQPVDYNSTQVYFSSEHSAYSDAKVTQYIIAGSVEELCLGKLEPLVSIYRDERRIIEENKEDIRDYTFHKIKVMKEEIYPEAMKLYTDKDKFGDEDDDLKDSHIILGEDWYLVYKERYDNSIYISDLARMEPNLEDEKGIQNKEILSALSSLLETYDRIEADLKEDTSYLLYLMNKKLGYLEQIGEDTSYSFLDRSHSTIISEEDQANILKNIKQIRKEKNPNLIMHHVTFRKKVKCQINDYRK